MSIATMILGQSGTGKTASLRDLDPADVLLIQPVKKPLPFRSVGWTTCTKDNPHGTVFVNDNAATICTAMKRTTKPIIVVDDFQYVLANEFMRRSEEKSYDKFTDIARHAWDILMTAGHLADNKRVYILAHTQEDDMGNVKAKSIGRLLDEKITIEGLLTIVMRTKVINGNYLFSTQNNGRDTVKTPMGMFDDEDVPNNLFEIDRIIQEFYGIGHASADDAAAAQATA